MQTSLKSVENPNNGLKLLSSKQIAERTGKDHGHVLRDIKNMISELDNPNLDDIDFQILKDVRGYISEVLLNEELCITLASGYSLKLRNLIIKEWILLKSQSQKALSRTDLARMVIEAEEEKEKLLLENSELKEKANYTDVVLKAESCHYSSSIAKEIGLKSAQELHRILHEKGILFHNGQMWLLYAKYAERGYTSTKTSPYYDTEGRLKTNTVTVWTEKGRQFIHSLLK